LFVVEILALAIAVKSKVKDSLMLPCPPPVVRDMRFVVPTPPLTTHEMAVVEIQLLASLLLPITRA
jgi:hypothetical protein